MRKDQKISSGLIGASGPAVEGESEEIAFRILLEEGRDINFKKYGIFIANYNGIGNLKNISRLMNKTLSHTRPMYFSHLMMMTNLDL